MKKILLNGCSFVAGDAISWNKYYPDIDWIKYVYLRKLHPTYSSKQIESKFFLYTTKLRPHDNLSGKLRTKLGTEVLDISIDGNTNDYITNSTIDYLQTLSPEERKNYHVCIGWTEYTRRLRWIIEQNHFFNLHHSHLSDDNFINEKDFIKEVIVNSAEFDHLFNYYNNILLLENYLKINGITYTFWRSLGYEILKETQRVINQPNKVLVPYNRPYKATVFFHNNIMDSSKWIKFVEDDMPWARKSWGNNVYERKLHVAANNLHPNSQAVEELSDLIVDMLKTSGSLNHN